MALNPTGPASLITNGGAYLPSLVGQIKRLASDNVCAFVQPPAKKYFAFSEPKIRRMVCPFRST